jgi:hypothetical protein
MIIFAVFKSARGLAQSKTLRARRETWNSRQVLECGSPLPLFSGTNNARGQHASRKAGSDKTSAMGFEQIVQV